MAKRIAILIGIAAMGALASGCTIGVKEKVLPVWCSHEPIPESVKGIPVIHTNRPIPCVIKKHNLLFKADCGGMVPVPMPLYERMLKAYNGTSD